MAKGTGITRSGSAANPTGVGTQSIATGGGTTESTIFKGNGIVSDTGKKAEITRDLSNPYLYRVYVGGIFESNSPKELTKKQAEKLLASINNNTTAEIRKMAKDIKKQYPETLNELHTRITKQMTQEARDKAPVGSKSMYGYEGYGDVVNFSYDKKTGSLNVVLEGKTYGKGYDKYNEPFTRLTTKEWLSSSTSRNKIGPERVAQELEEAGYKVKKVTLEKHYD